MTLDVSVVVPVYRTADAVPELGRRVARSLEGAGLTYELLLVDDACPAGSGEAAEALAARDERVAVVSLAQNVGQHAAALAGLEPFPRPVGCGARRRPPGPARGRSRD